MSECIQYCWALQKQEKKNLIHIKDCLSELKIQELIAQHKPLKTNKTKNQK